MGNRAKSAAKPGAIWPVSSAKESAAAPFTVAAVRLELVGVHLQIEAGFARGLENSARLVEREHSRLAEYVRKPCDSLLDHLRQEVVDQEVDELDASFVAATVFLRDLVCTKPG